MPRSHSVSYDKEVGTMKFILRGRPIIFPAPSDVRESFDVTKSLAAPAAELKLEWTYGYRGKDCRSNLHILPNGELAYFAASVAVLHNVEENTQRHYVEHTDDIKSMSIHPNKVIIATGQCAGHDRKDALPHVRVWDSLNLSTLAVMGNNEFGTSVNCLSFSYLDGGKFLVAVDDGTEKRISVWNWQDKEKVADAKCSNEAIAVVECHPLDHNEIVTAGKNHIAFWTFDQGESLKKRTGIFEGREKAKFITCVSFTTGGNVVSGDSNGNILVWERGANTISRFIEKVHEGAVFALSALRDGSFITGGGKDARIVKFDAELKQVAETHVNENYGFIRTLVEANENQLFVGTTRNNILKGEFDSNFMPIVNGHTEELWGLATHPIDAKFVTGGFDQLLHLIDADSHEVLWTQNVGHPIQSCAFSKDGNAVVVGTTTAQWIVYDVSHKMKIFEHTDGNEPIQAIAFSPDGNSLALGSRDNFIYVYRVNDECNEFERVGRCSGHSSFIKHIDWSADSEVIRSNSGDYETLYWNSRDCEQITAASSFRDTEWATQTCTLSFQTIGIWPESADGTDVNTIARNPQKSLLATGDDFGKVNLYRNPASQPNSHSHSYLGHSAHVTSVSFSSNGSRLISTGGNDTTTLQWKVV